MVRDGESGVYVWTKRPKSAGRLGGCRLPPGGYYHGYGQSVADVRTPGREESSRSSMSRVRRTARSKPGTIDDLWLMSSDSMA